MEILGYILWAPVPEIFPNLDWGFVGEPGDVEQDHHHQSNGPVLSGPAVDPIHARETVGQDYQHRLIDHQPWPYADVGLCSIEKRGGAVYEGAGIGGGPT